jgi:hypothetical protein
LISLTLASAIAGIGLVVVASNGSAQPSTARTITVTETITSSFQPTHPPRAGDRVSYAGPLRGSARGHDRSVCSIVTRHPAALCTTEFVFTNGTISAQSADFRIGPAAHATITGGSGVYNDTGGTVDIKSLSATRNTYTFHLTR